MSVFRFKQFSVKQSDSAMKVGTDAMILGALVQASDPVRILDVGSGTGVLSLMMAQRFPKSKVVGVELDTLSASESRENFRQSPWSNRLEIVTADFLQFESPKMFDLIVSNPPYYQSRNENEDTRKAQARHDSALPMEAMLSKVTQLVSVEGTFWVIVPNEVTLLWINEASRLNLKLSRSLGIRGKQGGELKRHVLCFKRRSEGFKTVEPSSEEFVIRDENGRYTEEYIELTKDFHFNNLR